MLPRSGVVEERCCRGAKVLPTTGDIGVTNEETTLSRGLNRNSTRKNYVIATYPFAS